jgi:hypothetical protein
MLGSSLQLFCVVLPVREEGLHGFISEAVKVIGACILECELDRRDRTRIRLLMTEGAGHKIENVLQEAHDGCLLTHPRLGVVGCRFRFCDASRDLLEGVRVVEDRDGRPARRSEAVNEGEQESPAASAEQGRCIPAMLR